MQVSLVTHIGEVHQLELRDKSYLLLSLFADDMTLYTENPKDYTKKNYYN